MENNFKAGDVVRFKNEHERKMGFNNEEYVVQRADNYYVGILNDAGELKNLYPSRFELVVIDKWKGIKEGTYVKSLADVGVSLIKGVVYYVEAFDGEYVKLKGIRNRIRKQFFIPCDAPAIIKDDGEKLLKELADKTGGNPGTCSYVLEFECGHKEWHIRDVCHARLNNYINPGKVVKQVALNVSDHYARAGDKDAYAAHVQYITQESPFKECFLPHPIDKILETGVLLDISKPYSRVVAAAIALRSGSEFSAKTKLFKEAIDIGFSGNVASILSTFFNKNANGSLTYNQWGGGHHYINSSMLVEHLVKFYEEGFHIDSGERSYKLDCHKGFHIFDSIAYEGRESFHELAKKLKGAKMQNNPGYWQPVPVFSGKNALVKAGAALSKYF